MTDPARSVHQLLTSALYQLDSVRHELERVAELLLEARMLGSGLDPRKDADRRQQRLMSDDHGPD